MVRFSLFGLMVVVLALCPVSVKAQEKKVSNVLIEFELPEKSVYKKDSKLCPAPREKYGQVDLFVQLGGDEEVVIKMASGPVHGKPGTLNGNIGRTMEFEERDGKLVLVYNGGLVRPAIGQVMLSRDLQVSIDGGKPETVNRLSLKYKSDAPVKVKINAPAWKDFLEDFRFTPAKK